MFLNNTLQFGLRTRLEHIELKWSDIELKTDSHGEEYLVHTERATKTRTGQTSDSRPFQPKMFASPGTVLHSRNKSLQFLCQYPSLIVNRLR